MPRAFSTDQWIAAPLDGVFAFFANPANLPLISPPRAGVKLLKTKIQPAMITTNVVIAGRGSEIDVSVRVLPWLPFRRPWRARITAVEYKEQTAYFEDEQASGPFRLWRHRHDFKTEERAGRAGTLIRDTVLYEIGWGLFGRVAEILIVRRLLRQMFSYRQWAAERQLSKK